MLDLASLRFFCAVVHHQSFRKAAHALNISQPALSRRIRMLEEQLGVTLMLRGPSGLSITESGAKLVKRSQALLEMELQTRSEVVATGSTPTGTLRIGVPPSLGKLLLGQIIGDFRRRFPSVSWRIAEGFSPDLRDQLLDDALDLAVVSSTTDHSSLQREALYSEQICLIHDSRLARIGSGAVSVDMIRELPLMGASIIFNHLNNVGNSDLRPTIELTAVSPTTDLIAGGNVYFIGQQSLVWNEIKAGRFSANPIKGARLEREIITRHDRPASLALLEFRQTLTEAINAMINEVGSPYLQPLES